MAFDAEIRKEVEVEDGQFFQVVYSVTYDHENTHDDTMKILEWSVASAESSDGSDEVTQSIMDRIQGAFNPNNERNIRVCEADYRRYFS